MSAPWIVAAAVSMVAHYGAAALLDDVEPRPVSRPPIEMQLAKAPPKIVEPPKPVPPPPPPPVVKPKLVTKVRKSVPQPPPPPETQRVGISEDATTDRGEIATPIGITTDGILGTGTSMAKDLPPPPPDLLPAAPPPPPKPKFLPSYEVTQLPKIKKAAQPEIPDAFRQAQREALVVIEVEIDARGRVVGARVMRHADYGLDDAALAAAKATEFEPALVGTTPVPVRYQIPYRFKVRG